MIHLSQIENPSEHVRNRSKRMWVKTVAPDVYIVKPKEKGKARRAVRLLQSGSGVHIECVNKETGELCPANAFGLHCSHAEAAINRLLINVKREAN
jgi:hypothetical protein